VGSITNGSNDWFIRQFAIDVRNWGHRILINWGHEMNIPEYPWSTSDTAGYRAAFRHIVNIFRDVGADNVEFVWSPNYMSHQRPDYNEYYPGDAYVDWVGVDGYNWGASDPRNPFRTWATFDMIFGPILTDFSQRYPDKPQMISETSCSPNDGGSKPQWITDAYASVKTNYWMKLKAVFWFQEKKEKDWRVQSSPSPQSLQAYRDAVGDMFFDGP
jgi:beta-mannanase